MAIEKVLVTPEEPTYGTIWTAFAAFVPDGAMLGEDFPATLISGTDKLWLTLHRPRRLDDDRDARPLLTNPPPRITWWSDVILPEWNAEPGTIIMEHLAEYLDGSVHDRA